MPDLLSDLRGEAPYGRIISVEEALEGIRGVRYLGRVQGHFIDVFERETLRRRVGIFHEGGSVGFYGRGFYVIGISGENPKVELVLSAGEMNISPFGGTNYLTIDVHYEKGLSGFKPLTSEETIKKLEKLSERDGDSVLQAFPLLCKEYDASIQAVGNTKDDSYGTVLHDNIDGVELIVEDEIVRELAERIKKDLEKLL